MLLYTIYTPNKPSAWKHEQVFAFASIERFVEGMRLVNEEGKYDGTLQPITKEEALEVDSLATLFDAEEFGGGVTINIHSNGVRDSWNKRWVEIHLVEKAEDENIPRDIKYA